MNTVGGAPISFNKELKNKIVIIDFWSSCCINCIHVLAEMDYLEKKFANFDEVAFIGCHSAKFENEKDTQLLRQAIVRYDIEHPVFNDRDFIFWESQDVNCWPTIIVVGPN
jgi:thiol-disulfide isomerase/thioredoxin